ncbi:MAG: hypothetical protein PHD19_11660 [Dechloromonas sp.]|nr:hypothetical protein [Dechloromonas sp.]
MSEWEIDPEACEARHPCGVTLRFRRADDGLGGWLGELAGEVSIPAVMRHFPGEQPAAVISRLAREAGEAYSAAMSRRH